MKYDLSDISAEISAVSMIITGLSNQIGEDRECLRPECLRTALFGVSSYLDRLANNLDEIECLMMEKEGAEV